MASALVTGIAQAAITVTDLEAAKRFYGETLGLAHLFDAPPALAFYQCGTTRLMLSAAGGEEGGTILYYAVEDVPAAHAELAARGAGSAEAPRIVGQVEGREIWLAVCRDPAGNAVGLISG
jgi:methylmalonyl-CoA/ethylmalonyl-CoA epimerase